jgi:dTDP-glucose 4,6-dehydratase
MSGYWQNKRVLVTGAGGFIGSHLAEELVALGAKVRAFVHYNAIGSAGWLDNSVYVNRPDLFFGDIRDKDSVFLAMEGIEIVFHLAALISIPYSYQTPESFVSTNVVGTLNLLQASRDIGVAKFIHTSTSEVYGTAAYVPIDENHPLVGQSPYSASKIGADKLVESYYFSFSLPTITIRPFNTFGPRQSARAVIPSIVVQALSGYDVCLGDLVPTRDLNYVSNIVDGFLAAGSNPNVIGQTINLGSGFEISIGNLATMIVNDIDPSLDVITDDRRLRPKLSEVYRLVADNALARKSLKWSPAVSLEDGIRKTITWIEKNLDVYRPSEYSL